MKLTEKVSFKPKVHYDRKKDILYIMTKESQEEEFVEIADGINVELDGKKEILGIEIFDASRFFRSLTQKLLKTVDEKLNRLLDLCLSGVIEQKEYQTKKTTKSFPTGGDDGI